ncbi:amidohydrolase family protein [Bradyrhizobium manausense]|uniref:amidohydrolase family protein n=1 Tax=Bradyrhizobium manausense TaxID=989370 RepID=UPI001BA6CC11|nr:amidohydrolase family protein [Bradyrhizobium manausense]MBR0834807.1 amidohydrolase family protein [Bradyrhizobium manausense]
MTEFLSPPVPVSRPKAALPPGATDCHAHVLGPFDRFPLAEDHSYTTADQTASRYLAMLDEVGFHRGVIVTPSAYGNDNRITTDALRQGKGRLRGVAVISPEITDKQLSDMHAAGFRGARFANFPGYTGTRGFDDLKALAPRLAELNWHAQLWAPSAILVDLLDSLIGLGLPLVVDHMGFFALGGNVDRANFDRLTRRLADGEIWLKLVAYRLSQQYPDYPDIAPFHRALTAANPDQLVWGSDWPHVRMTKGMPDVGHLVDLFDAWVHDDSLRRRIFTDNPQRLYGF